MKMKILFSGLLMLLMAATTRAQEPNIRIAFPTKDGVVGVGSGGENVVQVWASKDGRKFEAVQRCKGILLDAVVAGERLVVATSYDGLYVIALDGSWKVEHTPVKDDLIALAGNGQQAIALAATKQWQMTADGQWAQKPFWSANGGPPRKLAFGKGIWVVAAEGPADDMNTGGPTRISWSADGEKWQPAKIEPKNTLGIYALAGNAHGFLAITATGDGLFSADGKVWQAVKLPGAPLSSELFSAAGKFWLLERVDRPPHRLRSSTDGKTWTSENLPMEMRAQFLVEKDGQPWIFGTDAENFGLIARADKPDEPASPMPVAVAQAPTAPPNTQAAKPVTPTAMAPPPASNPTKEEDTLVSALERFEKLLSTAPADELGVIAADLLKAFHSQSSTNPAISKMYGTLSENVALAVEVWGGAKAYFDFVMKVESVPIDLVKRLPVAKQELIRKFANVYTTNAAYMQRKDLRRISAPDPQLIAEIWPVQMRDKRDPQHDQWIDMSAARRRLVRGSYAACFDLMNGYYSGFGGILDLNIAKFYGSLGEKLGIAPGVDIDQVNNNQAAFSKLADDGSVIAAELIGTHLIAKHINNQAPLDASAEQARIADFKVAMKWLTQAAEGGDHYAGLIIWSIRVDPSSPLYAPDKALEPLVRAAKGGHKEAQKALIKYYPANEFAQELLKQGYVAAAMKEPSGDNPAIAAYLRDVEAEEKEREKRQKRYEQQTKPASAADWFKLASAYAPPPTPAPTAKPATPAAFTPRTEWEMPTKLLIPARSLASFEQVFTNAADLAAIGPAAGVLLNNLDGRIEAPVFEAIFNAAVAYVAENAGIAGYMDFSQKLSKPLAAKADKLLPNDKLFKLTGAQFALMGGGLTEEMKQGWPAGRRTRNASQGRGMMHLDQARARLLSGDAGGAMDLALEYYNGYGVPTDTDLFVFYHDIAATLNPALKSLPKEPEAKIDALIAANSAHGRYLRASALLPKDQEIIPSGKARTLLEEAAALGHSLALLQLTNSDIAERDKAASRVLSPAVPAPALAKKDPRKEIAHGFEIAYGRQPNNEEMAYFLQRGITDKETLATILAKALESSLNANENAQIVVRCFRTLLRRNPTKAELAQWLAEPPKLFRDRAREIAATFPSYEDWLLDPDNVKEFADTSRLEMKIEMGMSDADIDRFNQQREQDSKKLHDDLRRQGITAEDVGKAMNDATQSILRDMTKDTLAQSCFMQARDANRKGDVATAQKKVEEGLSSNPNASELLVMRAKLNALAGKVAEADADLNKVIQQTPNYDWAHGLRALFRVAQRDWDGANASAAAALKLNATQPEALLALAQLDLTERKVTDAIAKLERNVTANPDFDDARFLYAMLLAENGQTAKAVAELETLCQRNPYAIAARERLIAYYAREANKPDEAWRHIRELEKLNHPKAKQYRNELEQILKTQPQETP